MHPFLENNLISTKEASEISGYHSDYLARMCRAGKIEGQQIGRAWLVSKESVLAFVREQEERKRSLAESLSKAREVEYQKVVSEIVKDVVESAESEVVKETPSLVAPVPRYVPTAPVPSPYVSKIGVFTRQIYALALTIVILGASSVIASSGVIASFFDTGIRLATSLHGIQGDVPVSSPRVYVVTAPEPVDVLAFGDAMLRSVDVLSAPAGLSAFALIEERTAFVPDPSVNLAQDTLAAFLNPFASIDDAKRAYLALIDGSGSSLLSIGVRIRDGIATLPASYLSFGTSFTAAVHAVQDAYEHGVYAWVEGASDVPEYATGSALALGRNISSSIATGIRTAPLAYERSITDFSEASRAIAHQALRSELAIGNSFGSLAYDTGLVGAPVREEASKPIAAAEQELAYVEEEPIATVTANVGLASPFAAFPLDSVSLLPDWFLDRAQYLARATYGSFSAFFDWAGYAVATITNPYTNRFPIVMVDYPRSAIGGTTTNIINTGTSTLVQNIYQNQFTEGASVAYVDTWVKRLQRAIDTNAENQSDSGGITTVSGDIHVNSLIVDTTGAFTGTLSAGATTVNGNLSVTGDANITGTLTVGSFTVSNLSVTSSLIGPYFTATSTTATSSFAGGFYAKRIEAGDYLAGPYVLATSTTATSVFSGNIAANGNTTLGDASSDTLTINASIDSSLIPSITSTYDLGSSTRTWRNAYIDTVLATNASSTYATSTTFSTTNFRLGSELFTSLLGNGLTNTSGVLSVSTSSLASGFFLQNGNSLGTTAVLGTNDAQGLQLETNNLPRITVDSSGKVGVGTSTPGSLLSLANIANFTTATSTFYATGGINLSGGCFAVNGTCITGAGGGGSGTVNTGTAGQIAYYESNGTAVSATSSMFVSPTGNVGIGTTSPYAKLSVVGQAVAEYFTATSTTATSTFALAQITNALRFGSDYLTDLTGTGLSNVSG
ncbi:MAG: helix-turn-helix domain-containing protein, partial [Patescibacteria group bacterium]